MVIKVVKVLTISFFENSENFLENGIYCAYMKNAPVRSYKALKKAKIAKNTKITNFDPLPLKNYDWKKSEKIQGNSWDGYEAI